MTVQRNLQLYLLVFTGGLVTLGVELSAARLLDPWFGNSLIIWANLIGLVLLYLSLGYWLGGRIADRYPRPLVLYRLAGTAALLVALVPTVSRPILALASLGFEDFDMALLLGSFLAVLVLFAPPVILLGCISPFAIRLAIARVEESGRTAGHIFALSTVGSILGVFLPVLVLIPQIGTRATFLLFASFLLLITTISMTRVGGLRDASIFGVAGIGLIILGWLTSPAVIRSDEGLIYERESAYNYIQVLERGPERWLRLNEGQGLHSVYHPQSDLSQGIWDYFLVAPFFNPTPYDAAQVQDALLIGLAGGTVANLYAQAYGPIPMDGVELDPEVLEAGRRYFYVDLPSLNAVAADGRAFLRRLPPDQRYSVIAVDAYRPPYIPFHLTTTEFFALVKAHLRDDGVVAVNVGRTRHDFRLVDSVAATMQRVFPSVFIIDEPVEDYDLANSLVVATGQSATLEDFSQNLAAVEHPLLRQVGDMALPVTRKAEPSPDAQVLTDDHAPVEQITHAIILRFLLGE